MNENVKTKNELDEIKRGREKDIKILEEEKNEFRNFSIKLVEENKKLKFALLNMQQRLKSFKKQNNKQINKLQEDTVKILGEINGNPS